MHAGREGHDLWGERGQSLAQGLAKWRCVGMTNWTNSRSGMSVAAVKRESGCHLSASTVPRQICRKRHGTNMRTLWHRPGSALSLPVLISPQAEMAPLFVLREQDNRP